MIVQTITSLKWVTTCSGRKVITVGTFQTNTIYTDLGIFMHTQAKSGIFRTLTYWEPDVYSEPWHIQNPSTYRTLAYSEFWHWKESLMETFEMIFSLYTVVTPPIWASCFYVYIIFWWNKRLLVALAL